VNHIRAFLALGSNLDIREDHLASALTAISNNSDIEIYRKSSVYETAPKYNPNQPDFLNMVVEIATFLTPMQLIDFCEKTEIRLGRSPVHSKNSAREIDLDILFYDRIIVDTPTLKIPHPGLYERKFVLTPLAEIAPDFIDPKTGKPVAELLISCPDPDRIIRIGSIEEIRTAALIHGVL